MESRSKKRCLSIVRKLKVGDGGAVPALMSRLFYIVSRVWLRLTLHPTSRARSTFISAFAEKIPNQSYQVGKRRVILGSF